MNIDQINIVRSLRATSLCLLILFSMKLSADTSTPTLALSTQHHAGAVDSYLEYLGTLPVNEVPVESLNQIHELAPSTNKKDLKHITGKSQWFKLRVEHRNSFEKTWYMATALSQAPLMQVYRKSNTGIEKIFYQDTYSNFHDRPYPHRVLVIPFQLQANEHIELYIQYKAIANYPMFPVVLDHFGLIDRTYLYELGNGIALGALLVLFLFFFTQFLIKPSQVLGVYCLLILSIGLFVCQLTGYSFRYFWPNNGEFGIRFSSVIGGFTYICYFLFSSALFNLKKNKPNLHRTIIAVASVCGVITFVGLFFDVSKLISYFAMLALPLPLVVAGWAVKNKQASSKIFAVGSSLHFASAYMFVLTCVGFDFGAHRHIFALAGLGQLIDICLFAGALIYQSKALREALNDNLQKRLEDAEQLANLEKEKSQTLAKQQDYILQLAAVSHDLKQPLASLKMALAVVSDDESKEAKTKMESTLNYTDKILRSLLESCREDYIDSVEQLQISELMRDLHLRHESAAQKKAIQLRFKTPSSTVNCSPVVLTRVLDNLLTNAIRHTTKGGVLVSVRHRDRGTLFQVWDTGAGIPQQQLKKLLQPYTQADPESKEGVGLGLFIVKTLCTNAGYRFDIRSEQGKGSCLSIFVPYIEC